MHRNEKGQAGITIAVVLVVVAAAVVLLSRTRTLAVAIDRKTESIATSGEGINLATKAIIKLDKTNEYGDSILNTAKPLEGQLNEVVRLAQSIDGTASSILNTAQTVNSTAKGINAQAAAILTTAQSINRAIETINRFVDTTIDLARQIKSDTGNILGQAQTAHKLGSCIEGGLPGGSRDGHCT